MKNKAMRRYLPIVPYVFVVFAIFIPQGICAFYAVPYSNYDESGVLKVLAYVTGNNIQGDMETAYYGWGSYIWMLPAFLLTEDPIMRYRALCVFSGFLQTLSGLFVFMTCYKYLFKKQHNVCSICIAVMIGYSCSNDLIIHNEHGLLFINCLVLWMLCKAFDGETIKKNYVFAALLAALYSLTMHTRAIILVLALLAVIIFYRFFLKVKLLKAWHIIVVFCLWTAVNILVKYMQHTIWAAQNAAGSIGNTSIGIDAGIIKYMTKPEFWKTMWVFGFGQVFAVNVVAGGTFILAFCVCINYLVFRRADWGNSTFQRNLFIMLVFGICAAGMIVGVGIRWGAAIYVDGLEVYGTTANTLKGVHYTRYSLNYALPLCVLALCLFMDDSLFKREYELYYLIAQFVGYVYWKYAIYPKVQNSTGSIQYFIGLMHRKPYTGIPYESLFYIIGLMLSVITITCLARKRMLYFPFLAGLLIYAYMGSFYCDTNPYQLIRSEYQRASYDYLTEQLTDQEFASIEKIYSYNVDVLREQYYIDKVKILSGLPEEDEAEAIIMYYGELSADKRFNERISIDEYKVYTLQEKCYLLVKGEKYLSFLE